MKMRKPKTVQQVFNDFQGRRTGLINALTSDMDQFFDQCDPERENVCLYGLPNGKWEVTLPIDMVPAKVPEPLVGINFPRDGMVDKDWQSLVAIHCDSWLIAIAFFFSAHSGFDNSKRWQLFQKMNNLPTVYEVVTGNVKLPKVQLGNHNRCKCNGKMPRQSKQPKPVKMPALPKEEGSEDEGEDEEDVLGATLCGGCGKSYDADEFWICCDMCESWFHGKCVKITLAMVKHINKYKCPTCSNKKRARV